MLPLNIKTARMCEQQAKRLVRTYRSYKRQQATCSPTRTSISRFYSDLALRQASIPNKHLINHYLTRQLSSHFQEFPSSKNACCDGFTKKHDKRLLTLTSRVLVQADS